MAASELRIVNFHGIGKPGRAYEPGEAAYWISAERFRDILDRIADHPDRDRLAITFDDGNSSDLAIGAPELRRRGLTAQFFVLTGRIGEAGSLSDDDIRRLIDAGMDIGSHGIAHRDWSSLASEDLEDELVSSKTLLEGLCGMPVRSAAIPFGRYNAAVVAALRKAGYGTAYSSDGGSAKKSAFLKPRTSIRQDTTDAALERLLSGRDDPWRRLRRAAAMTVKEWI
ncbi:polysaccharide deacetylase family protein [Mesorhizobium sp. CN2-181]